MQARPRRAELEVKLESVHAEHQQVDTAIEQHRVEHTDRTDAFNRVQASYYSLGSEVARIEQTIKHQQERARQLQEDLVQTQDSLQQAKEGAEAAAPYPLLILLAVFMLLAAAEVAAQTTRPSCRTQTPSPRSRKSFTEWNCSIK